MNKISIIYVNFNSELQLYNSILSFSNIVDLNDENIFVIDNKSTTKLSNDKLSFINIKYIYSESNLGFAKANNVGVKNSNSEYLCFLNPDTLLTEDFVSPLVEFIENNEKAGACAPMLVYENNSYQSSTGFKMGFIYEFLEASMLIEIYRKFIKKKYLNSAVSGEPIQVGWVSGACFIIKRSVFEEVGGFTEDYFLNYEDIDLCRRLEEHGYKNYYFPKYKCVHLDHKSFDSNFELLIYTRYQSRLIYSKRYYPPALTLIVRIMHIFGLLFRILLVTILYKGKELKSRKSGYYKSLKLYLFNQ